MNIVCVGDCGVDHYLPSGQVFCGGITANFALHASVAFPENDSITVISAIGNDDAAAVVNERLGNSRIKCRLTAVKGASSVQHIEVEADGEKNFVRYDEGVLRYFHLNDQDKEVMAASDLRVVPVFQQIHGFNEEVIAINNAGLTAVDFADFAQHPDFDLLDKYLDAIDVGFFGLSSDDEHLIDVIEEKADANNKLLVVTLGADGSIAFRGGDTFSCAAIPVGEVLDTTGAGDAFAAGFLSQYCYGRNIKASLNKGAALAAEIIQHVGAN